MGSRDEPRAAAAPPRPGRRALPSCAAARPPPGRWRGARSRARRRLIGRDGGEPLHVWEIASIARRTGNPRDAVLPIGSVRLQPAAAHLQLAPQREGHARRPVVVGDEVRRRRPRRGRGDGGDGGGGRDRSGRLGWGRDGSGRLGLGRRGGDRRELLRRRRGAGAAGLRHGLRRGRSRARLVLRRALERAALPSGSGRIERRKIVLELVEEGAVLCSAARRREGCRSHD